MEVMAGRSLVARAQWRYVQRLIGLFGPRHGMPSYVTALEAQYVAIVVLLRGIGHTFRNVDCMGLCPAEMSQCEELWAKSKTLPIFLSFIEPERNLLLKEFEVGFGLDLSDGGKEQQPTVYSPELGGPTHLTNISTDRILDRQRRPVVPMLREALLFWDRFLGEAEQILTNRAS